MLNEKRKIAIVGAGGFLGTTVLERVAARSEFDARAVVRSPRSLPMVLGLCKNYVMTGGREDGLAEAFDGMDAVVDVSVGPPDEIASSAAMIASACRRAGVSRLVYTSSAAAQDLRRHRWGASKPTSAYGRQKGVAEGALARSGLDVTIVRPGLIWGPRSFWTIRHIDALLRGTFVVPAADFGSAPNLAYAPNLADGLLNAAASEDTGGSVDFADSWWQSWVDYAQTLAAAIGVPDRVLVANRLRPGPWKALAVETVAQHPWLKGMANGVLERVPSTVAATVKARFKPPQPPAHVAPFADPPARPQRASMTQGDLDIFVRWSRPRGDSDTLLGPFGAQTRDEAVDSTVAWAREVGYVPRVEVAHA